MSLLKITDGIQRNKPSVASRFQQIALPPYFYELVHTISASRKQLGISLLRFSITAFTGLTNSSEPQEVALQPFCCYTDKYTDLVICNKLTYVNWCKKIQQQTSAGISGTLRDN